MIFFRGTLLAHRLESLPLFANTHILQARFKRLTSFQGTHSSRFTSIVSLLRQGTHIALWNDTCFTTIGFGNGRVALTL